MTTLSLQQVSRVKISDNRRFLVTSSGDPFFWLGDTAWDLLARMNREDIDYYLRIRAAQRFSVIQLAAVSTDAAGTPRANALGQFPFADKDASSPAEDYVAHLDYVITRAAAHGMYVAVLPWRGGAGGATEQTRDAERAWTYAGWLAARYKDQPVIWLIPGHQPPARTITDQVRERGGGNQLIVRLPATGAGQPGIELELRSCGPGSAALWRTSGQPSADAGHQSRAVASDLTARSIGTGGIAAAVRRGGYGEVFSGACGFSFIDETVWAVRGSSVPGAAPTWREALFHTAAEDMQFLRQLVESRPYQCRVPDQGMIVGSSLAGLDSICATRGSDGPSGSAGSYAFVYSSGGKPVTVDLTRLTGTLILASWFDPRTGVSTWLGQFPVRGQRVFVPPSPVDWVLVLEDSARHFQQVGFGSDRRSSS